jgi:MFS family permease
MPGGPASLDSAGPAAIRWRVAVVAISATATGVLPAFMVGALAVQIGDELSIGPRLLGALFGLFWGVAALSSPLLGRLVERRGWAEGMRVASMVSGLTLLGIALLAHHSASLAALLVLGGVGAAMATTSTNLALARSVPLERHGLLFGLKHVAVPASTMLAGLAVPAFGLTVGWRWAFITGAAVAFATAAASPIERRAATIVARHARHQKAELTTPLGALSLVGLSAAFAHLGGDALAAFAVSYAVHIGLGEGSAGLLLTAGSIASLLVRLISGWLIDRRPQAVFLVIVGMLVGGALGLAAMAAGGRAWLAAGVVVAFALGVGWAGLLTFAVVRANPASPAAATGITHAGTYVGAAAGPVLFGLLAQSDSYATAWWVAAAALAVAAIILTTVRRFLVGPGQGRQPGTRSKVDGMRPR